MSVLKVAVASIIALSLVFGLALPALADTDESIPWTEDFQGRVVKGTVTEVDEENQEYFKVLSGEDEIGIRVDEDTRYFLLDVQRPIVTLLQQFRLRNQAEMGAQGEDALKMRLQNQAEVNAQEGQGMGIQNQQRVQTEVQNQARLRVQNRVAQTEEVPATETQPAILRAFDAGADFSDIEVGDRVVVWLADSDNLAKVVMIAKPVVRPHVGGVITELTRETIEITPEDDRPVTLRYDENTVFVLNGFTSVEEGQLAGAVYDGENMLAKKVTVYLPGD